MSQRALILGLTGQAGSYTADLLLEKGYEVYGLIRRTSTGNTERITHLISRVGLIHGDITDSTSLNWALKQVQPDEIYNWAAMSHVARSFEIPQLTMDITGTGALNLFEAVRQYSPRARVYQSSSSEMFGNQNCTSQSELTPFAPVSPYAAAKVSAHHWAQVYRLAYNLHISCGINFNFESPRRGEDFVTRKVTKAIAEIKSGTRKELKLGNLYARRDWSHAKDMVRAAWLMLQQDRPDNYVIASGRSWAIREFVEMAFNYASLNWEKYVKIDPSLYRPVEVRHLQGNSEKARSKLGWKPEITFPEVVLEMVKNETINSNSK